MVHLSSALLLHAITVDGATNNLCVLTVVYHDGRVCISILHNPGDDPHGYESASERWSPVHTVRFAEFMPGGSSVGRQLRTCRAGHLLWV